MRKILFLLALPLVLLLSKTMVVNASAVPELSQTTLSVIEGGNSSLLNSSFTNVGVFPSTNGSIQNVSQLITNASANPTIYGAVLNTVEPSDISLRSLTESEIETNTAVYPYLYNSTGDIVNWDSVYFVHYDNGFVHGELYVDSNGDILTANSDYTLSMFQLGLGGKILGVDDYSNIYDIIEDQLQIQEFNISTENVDLSNSQLTLYYIYGYVSGGLREAWQVYLPNAYEFGVQAATSPFSICSNYVWDYNYNNGAPPPFTKRVRGSYNFDFLWQFSSNYTSNGYSYKRRYYLTPTSNTCTWAQFSSVGDGRYIMSSNGWAYSQDTADAVLNGDIVTFKPIQIENGSDVILQPEDSYSYDAIQELETDLNNIQPITNTGFDPSEDINSDNSPYNYPYTNPQTIPSGFPFPSTNVDPNPSPYLDYETITQPSFETSIESFQNLQVPFITGLQNRYPFSIPWDIQKFIQRFNSEPTPPAWNFDWNITIGSITFSKHFEGDLSDFNSLAEIFRNLLLIGFILGLCKFSYDHHF